MIQRRLKLEFYPSVLAHAGRNHKLYLSAYGRLPGTLQYSHPICQIILHAINFFNHTQFHSPHTIFSTIIPNQT